MFLLGRDLGVMDGIFLGLSIGMLAVFHILEPKPSVTHSMYLSVIVTANAFCLLSDMTLFDSGMAKFRLVHLLLMFFGGVFTTRMDFPLDSICPPLWGARTRILMLRIIQGVIVTSMYSVLVYELHLIGVWVLYFVLFGQRHWKIKERLYGPNQG